MKHVLMSALGMLIISGCGNNGGGSNPANQTDNQGNNKQLSLSYEFKELNFNGSEKCSTGIKVFNSLDALCDGLTQKQQNSQCALKMREDYFKEIECSYPFEETNFWMSTERVVKAQTGLCHIKYQGENPIRKKINFCQTLLDLFKEFPCGKDSLEKSFIENGCLGAFPVE